MFTPKRTLLHLANQAYSGFKGNRWAFANEKTPETLATLEKPKEKGAAMEVYEKLTSNTLIKKWDKAKNADENFKTVAEKLFPGDQAKQDIAGKMLIEALQGTHPETALNREKNVYFLLENGELHFFRSESEKKTQEDIDKMIGDPASYEIGIPAKGVQTTAPEGAFNKEDQEKALKIYGEANEKFKKGDFAGALPGFQEADKLVPDAMPKYKIAVSLDKLGRTREAIDAYQKFLDSNPDISQEKMNEHVKEAKTRIELLKQKLEGKTIRELDPEAEEKEKEREANETKGKEVRAEVFGGAQKDSGIARFKTWEKYLKTKISDIYPDALTGDTVEIRRVGNPKPITAYFTGNDWVYPSEEMQHLKKGIVTVENNDDLRFIPGPEHKKGPEAPEKLKVNGYFRVKEQYTWEDIAKTIMCTGKTPHGDVFAKNETPSPTPEANSPQALLSEKGYDPNNAEDVKKFAAFLQEVNSKGGLYVWIATPSQNPRVLQKNIEEEKGKARQEAAKRVMKEVGIQSDEIQRIFNKHYGKLWKNEDYEITPQLLEIVDNDDLWNYYWSKGQFKGKERIMKGMEMLNVPENKIRDVLLDAIQQGKNDLIDFEDLLDAFNHKETPVFKNYEGEPDSYDDFKKEYYYSSIAKRTVDNIDAGRNKYEGLSEQEKEFYEDYADEFEKGVPEITRGRRYMQLHNILEASALIMEGLGSLATRVNVETARKNIEAAKEEKGKEAETREKTGKKHVEKEPTMQSEEEKFLQSLFHPQNSRAIEETPEYEEGISNFEMKTTEATAYRMIEYNASVDGKLDRKLMMKELNNYALIALMKYKSMPDKEGTSLAKEKEKFRIRYGLFGDLADGKQPDFMNKAIKYFEVPENLKYDDSEKMEWVRNLVQDGFLANREIAKGNVEKAPEATKWVNYGEILNQAKNPSTSEVIRNLLARNPDVKFTEEELQEAINKLDMAFDQTKTIDINLGVDTRRAVDTTTGEEKNQPAAFAFGISKPFALPHGFTVAIGAAVDLTTGQPMVGVIVSNQADISDQWKFNVSAGLGAGIRFNPLRPTFLAGVQAGFTYMSAGEPDSAWRETFHFGGGVGIAVGGGEKPVEGSTSVHMNLTDINFGPYLYIGAGQKKDFGNQYRQIMGRELRESGYANVENKPDVKAKAEAIRGLPLDIGNFMMEVQYNNKWNDEQLVTFYETQMKDPLKFIAAKQVEAEAVGLSEWEIGGTINPVDILKKLVIGAFFKLDFIVASKLVIKESLAHSRNEKLRALDGELIDYLEKQYPGVNIKLEPETMEDKDKLISSEFSGDQLQRMTRTTEQPANMEMTKFDSADAKSFKETQDKYKENHLDLSIDPETKMYIIKPTETENYRFYIDPEMAEKNGLVLKDGKILIATTQNLTRMFVKRFDYFYPGEVDGAVQHTVITLSDNPNRRMGEISEYSEYFLESRYDRKTNMQSAPTLESNTLEEGRATKQKNLNTWENLKGGNFYTSESLPAEKEQTQQEKDKLKKQIALTDVALNAETVTELEKGIDLSNLKMSPDKFIQKYPLVYRQLTTNTNPKNIENLDKLIRDENKEPAITEDQLIRFKEELFRLSMSEYKGGDPTAVINQRLDWAERAVFIPFFQRRLAKLQPPASPEITAETLAKVYISSIRQNLYGEPKDLLVGQSIFTAVGTYGIEGIRKVGAETGQTTDRNKFIEAYDYAPFLDTKGTAITEEQRVIARILLGEHSELPTENNVPFLQSRLARKIFFMGKPGEVPNPLIDILGEDKFEQLTKAYQALNKGETTGFEQYGEAIEALKTIAKQVRDAQIGNGTPVRVDGIEARAVQIGGYYFVIKTTLRSGIYDYCKNPSTVYNEQILIYKPEKLQQYLGLQGSVASRAADVTTIHDYSLQIVTLGLTGVGVGEIKLGGKPPEEIPPATPAPAPKPNRGVGQFGGKITGGPNIGPSNTQEGSAGL